MKINKIFLLSALFFSFFSFFGVYEYKIYSPLWFFLFYVYEFLFFLGLSSGRLRITKGRGTKKTFEISETGAALLWMLCIIGILSFLYFVYLYRGTLGSFVFGNYTASEFENGRTTLEKLTLLLMQMGGDCTFLILMADKTERYKKLKLLSHFTLFLPGIRYLLMGARFAIAAEFLMLFGIKWPALRNKSRYSSRARNEKHIIVIVALLLGIAFLYLFSSRSIYYTALERQCIASGDMQVKPLWTYVYNATNGKVDPLYSLSDYLGEAPYVFSYFCKYKIPDSCTYGQLTFRSVIQIFHNLTGLGSSYGAITGSIASGQYCGFAYTLICEFGIVLSFPAAYIAGMIFAKIERYKDCYRICQVLYSPVKVICFFAPIYYFYVGRLDYTILFCIVLAPICLSKKKIKPERTQSNECDALCKT